MRSRYDWSKKIELAFPACANVTAWLLVAILETNVQLAFGRDGRLATDRGRLRVGKDIPSASTDVRFTVKADIDRSR